MTKNIGPLKNQRVVRSWSTQEKLVKDLDDFAEEIKEATGLHWDRSKILNALSELALEMKGKFKTDQIVNQETLKDALAAAIKKRK
ncbi:hypothetical protein EGT07_23710 [Herbaspirillum sp. HC18]|nr:hypothetical protein EGT07_23710 [Herbaspirillum sp. HC18]